MKILRQKWFDSYPLLQKFKMQVLLFHQSLRA